MGRAEFRRHDGAEYPYAEFSEGWSRGELIICFAMCLTANSHVIDMTNHLPRSAVIRQSAPLCCTHGILIVPTFLPTPASFTTHDILMSPRKGFSAWYDKVAAFNVESLFASKRAVGPPRTICVAQDPPPEYFDRKGRPKREHIYVTNRVITSKYTIITFLPRNLLEQFRRVANV